MLINNEPVHHDSTPLISLSAHSIQGKRNHMEDFFDIGYQMKPLEQRTANPNQWPFEYFYLGIFDGHGGSKAALYAKRHLLKFITKQADFWSSHDEDVKRAIRKGFADTHASMRRQMHSWPRTNRVLPSTAGTTASVLFIRNGKFFTGHVGDTRIVISQQNPETKHWISRQLTSDHKPESKQESQRIQRAGGEVRSKFGVHRVVWRRPILVGMQDYIYDQHFDTNSEQYKNYTRQITTYPVKESLVESYQIIPFLAIARSLGDFWSINPYSGQYIVSPEPDVDCRPITPNDKCILLATDGLWNVMNSTQAVRMLQELNILKSTEESCKDEYFCTDNFYDVAGHDSEDHAQSLVYIAYQLWERRRLRSDNITVVVAMLHDILNYHQTNTKLCPLPEATHENLKISIDNFCVKKEPTVQIGQTSTFTEKICLNREPKFLIPDKAESDSISLRWRRLESFLVLPPTLLEPEPQPKLVYPRNYLRLSNAECKRIPLYYHRSDPFIYIKHVSDDPADALVNPTRTSKSGKEVRDASAQATQSIHDFGQPWDQLLDDDIDSDEDLMLYKQRSSYDDLSDEEETLANQRLMDEICSVEDDRDSDDSPIDHGEDEELVFEHELRDHELLDKRQRCVDDRYVVKDDSDSHDSPIDHDDAEELVFENELREKELRRMYEKEDSDSDDNPTEEEVDKEVVSKDESKEVDILKDKHSPKNKDKKNIPQLRCLLNYTSPLRRSTRNSYMSLSDNSKRKSQINSSATIPKSKRRKSQPIRCNLSKA